MLLSKIKYKGIEYITQNSVYHMEIQTKIGKIFWNANLKYYVNYSEFEKDFNRIKKRLICLKIIKDE